MNRQRRRRSLFTYSIAVVVTLVIAGCSAETSTSGLPGDAQAIVDSAAYDHGAWGWNVVDLDSGETQYAHNENKLRKPGGMRPAPARAAR